MGHIDYEPVTSLDALIDMSDAAARATLVRLRERIAMLDGPLDQRVVYDGRHHKPVLAFFRGGDTVLHLYPEPNIGVGLHCAMPIRVAEEEMLDLAGLAEKVREAVSRARAHHNVLWVELVLYGPAQADDLIDLLARRMDLLPRTH
ncbi:MAG TPA: hypothetical protein VH877_29855 [Polyangia bacterium]|jgi:hypothetical protein|nr:hypothetical protein [Polyangia bacterium]